MPPDRFLGDQRASYNQELKFQLRIGGPQAQASTEDIILEGAGLMVSAPIFAQNNPLPNEQVKQNNSESHLKIVIHKGYILFMTSKKLCK